MLTEKKIEEIHDLTGIPHRVETEAQHEEAIEAIRLLMDDRREILELLSEADGLYDRWLQMCCERKEE